MMPVADHQPVVRKVGDGDQWRHWYAVHVSIRTQDISVPEQTITDQTCHLYHLVHVANLIMHDPETIKLQSSVFPSAILYPDASGSQTLSAASCVSVDASALLAALVVFGS